MSSSTWPYEPASIERVVGYPVNISTFTNQSEQRTVIVNKEIIKYRYTSPKLTPSQYADYQTFYNTMKGAADSFYFHDPLSATTRTVRFEPNTWNAKYVDGTWVVTFELKVLDVLEA